MADFTPGPWKRDGWSVIEDQKSEVAIAYLPSRGESATSKPGPRHRADARLIAAAPRVLAAAQSALSLLREIGSFEPYPVEAELSTAIAEALGEPTDD